MSAWVVSRDHIDLVVTEIIARKVPDPETGEAFTPEGGTDLGRYLWSENIDSVRFRYCLPDDHEVTKDYRRALEEYAYRECPEPRGEWRAGTLVESAVRSLRYQSCEHPTWSGSRAAKILDALEAFYPPLGSPTPAGMLGWDFMRPRVDA